MTDEMAEYRQAFLDETEEQLDDLVETMLALESDPSDTDGLNEAFRLIHSIKGNAGMMGYANITALTHHLENRFERFRSRLAQLDEPTMNLVLRCIDYLRQCNNNLRDGERTGSPSELLDELVRLEEQAAATVEPQQLADEPQQLADEPQSVDSAATQSDLSLLDIEQQGVDAVAAQSQLPQDEQLEGGDTVTRIVVRFQAGLQLADLKAQLIVARLAGLGDIKSTQPDLDRLADAEQLEEFEIQIETHEEVTRLHEAVDVDGVASIDFSDPSTESFGGATVEDETDQDAVAVTSITPHGDTAAARPSAAFESTPTSLAPSPSRIAVDESQAPDTPKPKATVDPANVTMRVDIDRLDSLMNLAGELVVNRARFVQVSEQISPALRKASMLNRIRDFSESLRHTIESMKTLEEAGGRWSAQIQQLQAGLELMDEQSAICENGRQCFGQISEAIDQLSRVSNGLQRGVLETRMVPVGPLFNRFKRVVRDLSKERGKEVTLLIRGEKTELDKRMVDELGDPLVHLVRNSIDHGLEAPSVRVGCGKPEAGTVSLEASHSGNSVYIHVRDDGGGIDVERIKAKLIDKRILSESAVDELSDEQALDYIWHPGFSTAQEVTDVSGRGVGMDAVKTRINQLNGTIEVDSSPSQGTTFTIRLPLTLAILNSLLVRLRSVIFSMPIDDVREIVSIAERDIVTVHQKQTFDVRGEFILLVSIDDIFQWHAIDYGRHRADKDRPTDSTESVDVVILQAAGKTVGLRVDELLGRQDVVIKSLADNFINIRGLSGASILGDGSVSLMLDVGTVIDMATRPSRTAETEEVGT